MHYTVTMKYKDITAETTVEAGSEQAALEAVKRSILVPFQMRYRIGDIPDDAVISIGAVPEPDPVDEVASLEAEKAAIEARLVEARGKVAAIDASGPGKR